MCKNIIKLFVLSCIFVSLLGLSCQSLASFETKDIYNLVYNYFINNNNSENEAKQKVDANIQDIENHISIYADNEDYNLFVEFDSAIKIFITKNAGPNYHANNYFYITSIERITYYPSSNTVRYNGANKSENRGTITAPYWTNQTIYTNSNQNTIYWSGIHNSPSWFLTSGPYDVPDAVWEFVPAPNDYLYLSLDNENKFYKLSKTMNYLDLGTLADSVYTGSVITQYYFYNKASNDWDFYLSLDDFSAWNGQNIGDIYTTNVIDDIMYSYITAKSKNVTENVIIDLVIAPYDNQPVDEGLNCWFYVVGPHTVINSGDNTVNVTDTFNDDYYNDYIDGLTDIVDDPTNSLLNAITDLNNSLIDNSLVVSIFDDYFSGDSGDIANEMGFVDFGNPFLDFFDGIASSIKSILLSSGHNSVSFTMHGHTYTISADIFIIPNGVLRTFVALLSNFIIILTIYKFLFNLFANVIVGELGPVYSFLKRNTRGIANLL